VQLSINNQGKFHIEDFYYKQRLHLTCLNLDIPYFCVLGPGRYRILAQGSAIYKLIKTFQREISAELSAPTVSH
jgi:hypothetical protein